MVGNAAASTDRAKGPLAVTDRFEHPADLQFRGELGVEDAHAIHHQRTGWAGKERPSGIAGGWREPSGQERAKAHFAVSDALVSFGDLVERVGFGHYFDFSRCGDL